VAAALFYRFIGLIPLNPKGGALVEHRLYAFLVWQRAAPLHYPLSFVY